MSQDSIPLRGRLKRAALVTLAFALPLGLGACAETVGAGAGAYAGNQFGHGSGKTAATIGGAVGGAAVGHAVAPGF
ncbi:MAG TPA: glycine zipper 2TM domain-containing protein [Aliidongia sp.]|nr:glycine zipper 2TM domain-containing protein [Aliidongia sp.]